MTTATELMRMADDNARVRGTYYGTPFTGRAASSRQVTTRPWPEELTVILAEPINVFDYERDVVLLYSHEIDAGNKGMSICRA